MHLTFIIYKVDDKSEYTQNVKQYFNLILNALDEKKMHLWLLQTQFFLDSHVSIRTVTRVLIVLTVNRRLSNIEITKGDSKKS